MDKKKVLLVVLLIVVIVALVFCVIKFTNKPKVSNEVNTTNAIDIEVASKITIGQETQINQLEQVPIGDSDDYLVINEKVKWEVPEHEEGTTVSFSIAVPYTIHVDGVDYDGTYYLGDTENEDKLDKNPKYDFSIVNLGTNYETKVLVKNK